VSGLNHKQILIRSSAPEHCQASLSSSNNRLVRISAADLGRIGIEGVRKTGDSRAERYDLSRCLVRKLLSALRSSSGENLAAVLGGHSLSEAVLLLAMDLFRLICSEH